MAIRKNEFGRLALLLLLAAFAGWNDAAAQETPPVEVPAQETPAAEAVEVSCGDCHELAATFALNPHARGAVSNGVVENAACETCHEGAAAHIEGGGDPEKITKPAGRSGADGCLTCHDSSTHRRSHRSGAHANSAAVNCFSCHSIHSPDPKGERLLVKTEPALCAGCHSTQVTSLRSKPFAHRMRGGMKCTTCHETHGRAGRESTRLTASGEMVCATCHTEKRGPFVFEHGAASMGDCMSCHEAHGSSNPRQLKRASVSQLCLECHSTGIAVASAGSQPPSFHNMNSARFQNCTTCHVAVHGSNRSALLLK